MTVKKKKKTGERDGPFFFPFLLLRFRNCPWWNLIMAPEFPWQKKGGKNHDRRLIRDRCSPLPRPSYNMAGLFSRAPSLGKSGCCIIALEFTLEHYTFLIFPCGIDSCIYTCGVDWSCEFVMFILRVYLWSLSFHYDVTIHLWACDLSLTPTQFPVTGKHLKEPRRVITAKS